MNIKKYPEYARHAYNLRKELYSVLTEKEEETACFEICECLSALMTDQFLEEPHEFKNEWIKIKTISEAIIGFYERIENTGKKSF